MSNEIADRLAQGFAELEAKQIAQHDEDAQLKEQIEEFKTYKIKEQARLENQRIEIQEGLDEVRYGKAKLQQSKDAMNSEKDLNVYRTSEATKAEARAVKKIKEAKDATEVAKKEKAESFSALEKLTGKQVDVQAESRKIEVKLVELRKLDEYKVELDKVAEKTANENIVLEVELKKLKAIKEDSSERVSKLEVREAEVEASERSLKKMTNELAKREKKHADNVKNLKAKK